MIRAIKKNLPNFAAIIGLIVIATGVTLYILDNQRLRFPYLDDKPFVLKAEFETGQAVTAGQGQTVRVSGVRIGDIGDVELENGRALVTLEIDQKFRRLVKSDASALLRPKTGLKDMFVELDPGGEDPDAKVVDEGFVIPIENTAPDVNPDEFLSVLDQDTRDYLVMLIDGAGRGLENRGDELAEVFRRFEPTHRDLARVQSAVATRRKNLKRLIRSLNVLNTKLAEKDDDLTELVDTSATVFNALASEERNVSATVRRLPGALRQTTETLGRVERFADILRPTADRLRPAVRSIDVANRALIPLGRRGTPLLRDSIRPFVREARPLVRDLRPASRSLATANPDLTVSFDKLNRLFNMLAFNPNGKEPPEKRDRQEGYLFWQAWAQHLGTWLFSQSDAHGTFRPVAFAAPCATFQQLINDQPGAEALLALTPLFQQGGVCE